VSCSCRLCAEKLECRRVSQQILSLLSVTLGVESGNLIAVMRDGVTVNAAAMRTLKIMYPDVLDIRCISHTLDLVGDKFKAPNLSLFFTL